MIYNPIAEFSLLRQLETIRQLFLVLFSIYPIFVARLLKPIKNWK